MVLSAEEKKTRLAKNTMLLYMRMLVLMVVSLYTSRVILHALGETDFGIYNVVGGVVAAFSFISGSLSAAVSRFITFELGKNDMGRLKRVFAASVTIQLILALAVLALAETVGVWFLNTHMTIPDDRIHAANWVLNFSAIAFAVSLISTPYNAVIVAHERMSAFAYISLFEAFGKLAIAVLILYSSYDRLIVYSILVCVVAVTVRLLYGYYCKRHFAECVFHLCWDRDILGKMFGFAGWNFIGASSSILRDQGGNILLNIFFGPSVNAARGIAVQVNTALMGFVTNFTMALNPQITKSYASGNHDYMMYLIYKGARFSFYMLLLLSLPVIVNTHYILVLWLRLVPEHTVAFVQLILLFALSECISSPLITAMLATGRIRNYQIAVGGLQMMNLPVSYVAIRLGFAPESVFVIALVISQCCLALRICFLRGMIRLSVLRFVRDVYVNILLVALCACVIPVLLTSCLHESFVSFVALTVVCIVTTSLSILYIGMNRDERLGALVRCRRSLSVGCRLISKRKGL